MKRNILTVIIGAVLVVIFALLLFVFPGAPVRGRRRHDLWQAGAQPHRAGRCISNGRGRSRRFINSTSASRISRTSSAKISRRTTSYLLVERLCRLENFRRRDVFPEVPRRFACRSARAGKLESMLRSAKIAVIGKHTLSEFVNADPKELKFDAIESEIEQTVQARVEHEQLRHETGISRFQKNRSARKRHANRF